MTRRPYLSRTSPTMPSPHPSPLRVRRPNFASGNGTAWNSRTTGSPSAVAGASSWPPSSSRSRSPVSSPSRRRRSTSRPPGSSCPPPASPTPARPTPATSSPPSGSRPTPTWSAAASWPTRWRSCIDGEVEADDLTALVSATVVPETVILEITATDPDPERASGIAQAYAEELQDLVDELETPRASPPPSSRPRSWTTRGRPTRRSPRSRCATSPWPASSACCWASVSPSPASCSTRRLSQRRHRRRHRRPDPGQHRHRRRRPTSRRSRSSARPPRGPRPSGCCAPTCSTSRSTRTRRSS